MCFTEQPWTRIIVAGLQIINIVKFHHGSLDFEIQENYFWKLTYQYQRLPRMIILFHLTLTNHLYQTTLQTLFMASLVQISQVVPWHFYENKDKNCGPTCHVPMVAWIIDHHEDGKCEIFTDDDGYSLLFIKCQMKKKLFNSEINNYDILHSYQRLKHIRLIPIVVMKVNTYFMNNKLPYLYIHIETVIADLFFKPFLPISSQNFKIVEL